MSSGPASAQHGSFGHPLLIALGLPALGLAIAAIVLAVNWPFTEAAIAKALSERFAKDVTIRHFQRTYFPPGCVAQGVEFLHRQRKDLPPLITVQTLAIRGSYSGLLRIHQQIDRVQVAGLHVRIPAKAPGGTGQVLPLTQSKSGKNLNIGEIVTDDAVLEFLPGKREDDAFVLTIDHLTLDHLGENNAVAFHARFDNTMPPGQIHSDGQWGPWDDGDPAATKVSGSYVYQRVNLKVFEGIAGTLSSQGKFGGTLGYIETEGTVDVPDFSVTASGHAIHIASTYQAVVNGTNGDTSLTRVESHFGKTTVISRGDVKGRPGVHGKTAALKLNVDAGRVEDLLRMFASSPRPSETGNVRLQMQVELPPAPPGFLRRLRLTGDFGIGGGRFTKPALQVPVNRLAESASGEKKAQEEVDPRTILTDLKGHFSARGGVATLSNVSFSEPGSLAQFEGTYNLLDKQLNLKGVLRTSGKLGDTTAGFKSVVLKALTPFLKRQSITVVPFVISGTSSDPKFSLNLSGKRTVRRASSR